MRIRELVPWRHREREQELSRRGEIHDPFTAMERQMRRYFDDFFEGFDLAPFGKEWQEGTLTPKVDVAETNDAVHVTADLPGLTENDIEVTLSEGHLHIRGEKHAEKEDKNKNYHRIERTYGSFQRSIALPAEVNSEKVDASFKNGVLSIVLPKVQSASSGKKITVKKTP
ncbi:MAG TPA: Hsp20/alpha crystallin family protein [Planctomycetaceae bacterium]|nr:Hsp20/alpha crystallin family protein [Planctomycetaceae bacterium]